MSDELSKLFDKFDRGRISRRQLLKALGMTTAAALTPIPAFALAQPRGERQEHRDTTPAKLPFEPTGWKTTRLDFITCEVADHEKEAAFYNALMNWRVRSDSAAASVLDIGNWGGFVIRGGYHASPGTVAAERQRYAQLQSSVPASQRQPFRPVETKVTSFSWGIEPWDAKTVEAELKKRGLTPVAEHHDGFESFHVKDQDGFDLQISNGRWNPRSGAAHASLRAPAPFAHTDWKTIWLDHISFMVPDYKRSVAFYEALLGWKPGKDTGYQNQCEIGDVGDIIIRTLGGPGAPTPPGAKIDHLSFGITPFDPDAVKAALEKRGLGARVDAGTAGMDIHTSVYKSYHTVTPNGYNLQISNVTLATRDAASIVTVKKPSAR